jgi:maltose alpha-D-glucosyltransferase/alpha-amylase
MDPVYGHQSVNVESQQRSPSSLLNWHKRLIGVRRSTQAFSRGSLTFVRPANRTVLGYIRSYENDTVLCVANLSRSAQSALFDLRPWKGRVPMEMLGRSTFPRIGDEPYAITLAPFGFFWFLLTDAPQEPKPERPVTREHTTLVWTAGWNSLLANRERYALENDVLPAFLRERRWFAEKAHGVEVAKLDALIPVEREGLSAGLALVRVASARGATSLYQVPLILRWTRPDRLDPSMAPNVLAAIRRGPREGSLVDAAADKDAMTLLLTAVHDNQAIEEGKHRIEFTPTSAFKDAPQPTIEKVTALNREQSNTTVIVDRDYVIKVLRKVNEGIHPEIEMGRFLIEHTSFRNVPDLLGSAELVEGSARSALAVVHRFVENQGDAWTVTGAFLDRFVDDQRVLTAANAEEDMELTSYLQRVRQIGRRTGEFQAALASRPDIPDFAPEPIRPEDVTVWTERLVERSGHVLDLLNAKRSSLEEAVTGDVDRLLQVRPAIEAHIRSLLPGCADTAKARHHGDFHLGQVLIVKDDAFILDLEGEPGRSLEERRQKVPAARDIAGMLRSIDYSTTAALANATNLTAEERTILKPKLAIWRQKAMEEFWNACRQTADAALWPPDAAESRNLLEFFLLEKAFYEMEYELMNRPAWLHVPLEGTLRILAHHGVVQL